MPERGRVLQPRCGGIRVYAADPARAEALAVGVIRIVREDLRAERLPAPEFRVRAGGICPAVALVFIGVPVGPELSPAHRTALRRSVELLRRYLRPAPATLLPSRRRWIRGVMH